MGRIENMILQSTTRDDLSGPAFTRSARGKYEYKHQEFTFGW